MNRRTFIKSFAALAAAAVAPTALAKLSADDTARLIAAMRAGLVENQWFEFDGPIVINIDNLTIRNCVFRFRTLAPMISAITVEAESLFMEYCHIDCGPHGALAAIAFPRRCHAIDQIYEPPLIS